MYQVFPDLSSLFSSSKGSSLEFEDYQRRGIRRRMLEHAEHLARDKGAHSLRSGAGIDNIDSQGLHVNGAFKPYRIEYEKLLDEKRLISEKLIRDILDPP